MIHTNWSRNTGHPTCDVFYLVYQIMIQIHGNLPLSFKRYCSQWFAWFCPEQLCNLALWCDANVFSFHIGQLELLFNISNLLKAYHISFGIEVQVVNELYGSFSTRWSCFFTGGSGVVAACWSATTTTAYTQTVIHAWCRILHPSTVWTACTAPARIRI